MYHLGLMACNAKREDDMGQMRKIPCDDKGDCRKNEKVVGLLKYQKMGEVVYERLTRPA